jgi:prepilin-type processing-associated H-X9-DG protein
MPEATSPRLSKTALAAFVVGASSLFLLVPALPGLYLGVQAIRTINHSDGRLHGRRLAIAGLALSVLMTAVTVLGSFGMILFYVQEKSHVAACANNLRQMGQAIQGYSDRNDHFFPPGTVPNPALAPEQRLSWQAAILPFLSEGGVASKKAAAKGKKQAEAIDLHEAWDAPANAGLRHDVRPYLCPTFAHELAPDQVGLTSYVGVAGLGEDAATLPRSDARAGFFGYDRLLRASDISARLDATLSAIETMRDNGPWPAGGSPTVRGVPQEGDRYIGKEAVFGGLHRSGANVLWADGSVRLVTEKIDPELFRSQARIGR